MGNKKFPFIQETIIWIICAQLHILVKKQKLMKGWKSTTKPSSSKQDLNKERNRKIGNNEGGRGEGEEERQA